MSDNLVLDLLRAIRSDVSELRDNMNELKDRVRRVEVQGASISRRLYRVGGDIAPINRRLELNGAAVTG